MKKLLSFLSQPYPFENYEDRSHPRKLVSLLSQGVFITAFLFFFEPFDISSWNHPNKNLTLVVFGSITTLAGLIIHFVIQPIFPKIFRENKWTIGKEILSTSFLILLIALGNFSLLIFIGAQNFTFASFIFNVSSVLILGVFPITFGVLINYIVKLKKYQKHVNINLQKGKKLPNSELLFLAENEKDTLAILLDNLLFIESADNYAVFYFLKDGKISKEMLRSSLTRLEGQIESEEVVRCHRSFIVNLNQVENVSGNAQGYKLHLKNCETLVPVARKYSDIIEKLK